MSERTIDTVSERTIDTVSERTIDTVSERTIDAGTYGPVTDWATDLDHADPEYNRNAHRIWRDLVEGGMPDRPLRPLRRHVGSVDA